MDGQKLYEARVLELVRQSVMLSVVPVTCKTASLYFATDAIVIHLQKLENQDKVVPSESGSKTMTVFTGTITYEENKKKFDNIILLDYWDMTDEQRGYLNGSKLL